MRLKGRYVKDAKYFYIENQVEEGMREILRFPCKELDVVEVSPDRHREIKCREQRDGLRMFTFRELLILITAFALPIIGVIWAVDMLNYNSAFIIYWIITFIVDGIILYANWRVK